MKRHVGVMGGSFNPVHVGHIIVADYIRQHAGLDSVLMMLSPMNPLKADSTELIDDSQRMAMLEIACGDVDGLEPCSLELDMPRPSYTINTLNRLREMNPDTRFSLIIGSDNWLVFDRWRSADEIIREFGVIVYPRPSYELPNALPDGGVTVDAPKIDISSTFIREQIAAGYDMNLFLPRGVYSYIRTHKLYQ